ncbi:unnamed protein product [Rhizophagus irregularis]|nr:unnamed protein product [Rhizophagus irregularis]
MQLRISDPEDIIIEWIPYNKFFDIEEVGNDDFSTIYSAKWVNGPLYWNKNSKKYIRKSKEVALKYSHYSQNIDGFIIEAKTYSINFKIYGISQDPKTKDYILILKNYKNYCIKCNKVRTNTNYYEWCKECEINFLRKHLINWSSGNEKIDNFINKRQLEINNLQDIVLEWIPYDRFLNIKKLNEDYSPVYLAKWEGPLRWNYLYNGYIRKPKDVALKYSHDLQDVDEFINEVKAHLINFTVYGISQNPITKNYIMILEYDESYCIKCNKMYANIISKWCKKCIINFLREDFTNWTSGNEKIDNFIQEMQLKISDLEDIIFEWIQYELLDIEEVNKDDFSTICLAKLEDGPLYWSDLYNDYIRIPEDVALKYSHNLQDVNKFLDEIKAYSINFTVYGVSQDPNTKDYIIVLKNNENNEKYCIRCNNMYANANYKWCKKCQINYLKKNFINWSSGNEKIDNFIQEMQLKISNLEDIIFEWIPYYNILDIEEVDKDDFSTIYLAKLEDGPLYWNYNEYMRKPKEVVLKYSHNLQDVNKFLDEVKSYSINFTVYGISQDPNTKDYIIVIVLKNNEKYCVRCNNMYTDVDYKWCKKCQINYLRKNFINWSSGNEKIDNFIQEMQLKINNLEDIIFEWIPYNIFLYTRVVDKDDFSKVCLAKLEDGPLYWNDTNKYIRNPEEVVLKYFHNLQDVNKFLDEVKAYLINFTVYGISQDLNTKDYIVVIKNNENNEKYCIRCNNEYTNANYKWCKKCQINYLRKNFINWSSGNKKIDNFIQGMQLKISNVKDTIFEWIPYNILVIEEMDENDFSTGCLAKLKDGPLYWNYNKYMRKPKEVILKYSRNSRNVDKFLDEVETWLINFTVYGISQNPSTRDYIIILKNNEWCRQCKINYLRKNFTNQYSGNEKIDNFIQEMQLKFSDLEDVIFEWIPYDKLLDIEEVDKDDFSIVCSAKLEDGPLYWNFIRKSENKAVLKFFFNLRDDDKFLNEVKAHLNNFTVYGISQDPNTKDYIIVLKNNVKYCIKCNKLYTNADYRWCKQCQTNYLRKYFTSWSNGNKKIDKIIQEMQLKINRYDDIIFEWISYNQFNDVKKIGKYDLITIYSAKWKDGPLEYNTNTMRYERNSNKLIKLKYFRQDLLTSFNKAQNVINEFLDEVIKNNDSNCSKIYGISQNPNTKDFIFVEHFKNFISGNNKIDDFIDGIQLEINDDHNDTLFEWISYSQFNNIKKIGEGGFSIVYSAIWKDGLLKYDRDIKEYKRNLNTKVALKYLKNSQNVTNEFLNEIKAHSVNNSDKFLKVYGISQDPNTKDYIIVLQYAEGGSFNNWIKNNYKCFNWLNKLKVLNNIVSGLKEIHQKQMVHHDLHTGNILFDEIFVISSNINVYISDMGLCKKVDDINKTNVCGVMPYVAPEVLRGKPYTQAADIYSFGMVMYFVATGKQPFANYPHDELLTIEICKGIRPEINEPEAPKCYIDLMKKCWDPDINNRPDATKVEESIDLLCNAYFNHNYKDHEIKKQFKEAEKYRRTNLSFFENSQLDAHHTHSQAIYTSRLLNTFTRKLENYDKSECLDCEIVI